VAGRLACGVGLLRMVGILSPFGLQDQRVKRRKLLLWVELPWKIKYLQTLANMETQSTTSFFGAVFKLIFGS
jgi:hypothetical protein